MAIKPIRALIFRIFFLKKENCDSTFAWKTDTQENRGKFCSRPNHRWRRKDMRSSTSSWIRGNWKRNRDEKTDLYLRKSYRYSPELRYVVYTGGLWMIDRIVGLIIYGHKKAGRSERLFHFAKIRHTTPVPLF